MKRSPNSMIIRDGAVHRDLAVTNEHGHTSTFDMGPMTKPQLAGVREMVVNYWCRLHGYEALYD
jgi:hypothetical protein